MKSKLLIIGAGGHGRVIADIAMKMGTWTSIQFLDNNDELKISMGLEIIGKSNEALNHIHDCDIFVAIGDNQIRKKVQVELEGLGATIPTLIHPSAIIGHQVNILPGVAIMAGVVINSCTIIGKGCIINTSASIDHDAQIGDYVHVSPGVHMAGAVNIGEEAWLGIGSIVSNNVTITKGCKVGAGAVVVNDIVEIGTYIGVPARKM